MNLQQSKIQQLIKSGAALACAVALSVGPVASASAWRKPVADGLANPGIIQVGSTWVVHSTGSWRGHHVGTATKPGGPYAVTTKKLLTKKAAWMSGSDASVWAPSVVQATNGVYVAFYAAVVNGTSGARCIGTGTSAKPQGPFVPKDRALACWKKSGASPYDTLSSEGRGFSLIDPTPTRIGSSLVLTYKTQFKSGKLWHTTTRLVALNPADPTTTVANPRNRNGNSIKITDARNTYIEENPVLVARGGKYTLFTSWGWYGRCVYSTRYRQNASLWNGWLKKKPAALSFAKKPNTCGTGNAQVVKAADGSWLIFFNGHTTKATPGGPKGLYVGNLG